MQFAHPLTQTGVYSMYGCRPIEFCRLLSIIYPSKTRVMGIWCGNCCSGVRFWLSKAVERRATADCGWKK